MRKRILCLLCAVTVLLGSLSGLFPVVTYAGEPDADLQTDNERDLPLRLLFDTPAPILDSEFSPACDTTGKGIDRSWEQYSLPIGNAFFGVNVFGRTETERIQITEKTLYHTFSYSPDSGGLNNFSETFIDFGHSYENVSGYERYLDLPTATTGVRYTYGGVTYTREMFASYPDRAFVIKLSADTSGALSFTLRPTIPYEQDYMYDENDGKYKHGTVTSSVTENGVGIIELEGSMAAYEIDFLGIYKVYSDGEITASTVENNYTDITGKDHTDIDGTIVVNGAQNAYIVVTLGTDYELVRGTFNSANPPTVQHGPDYTRAKVDAEMSAIDAMFEGKTFEEAYQLLKSNHIADHSNLFGRVSVDLDCDENDFGLTTETLIQKYRTNGYGAYLEVLLFQYGRYLLIASSRDGTLPANLQGVWNSYNTPSLGSGYWHDLNVQMNYWPAFSTNLAETFEAYVDYNNAYMPAAEGHAWVTINKFHPELLGKDGGNGWVVGVAQHGFTLAGDNSCGDLGFTTQMFWDYYQFTKDPEVLQHVYDVIVSAAKYITKLVELDEEGHYLVPYSNSPEVKVNGAWYYSKGSTYAQTFAYLNNYHALATAKALGVDLENEELLSGEDYSILKTILEQLDKYDPVHVGLSGQVKEFREEDYYSSIGDDPNHRHISQLVGLYPGEIINSSTPAWLDAAKATLAYRSGGDVAGGWVLTHKNCLYARAKDGEKAHEMVQGILSRCTFPNLFTKIYSIFQIDSNFGYTAGVAEMLLQSHEGYIEPLAAIPEAWNSGSYSGLVARGNFEVSAAWKDGLATSFRIKSGSGEVAKIYYPSITGAKVTAASTGEEVNFERLGDHLIGFDTEIGETYIVSGFKTVEKPAAPEVLNYSREGDFGAFTLVWSPVAGAVSYNVSVAIENAPSYDLIGNTAGTSFVYTPAEENDNVRTTFVVTALNADGTESARTLCYYNPIDTAASVAQAKGYVTDAGELQVVVKSNANTVAYRLYEKAFNASDYSLVSETTIPVLRIPYSSNKEYAVSVLSFHQNEESDLFKIGSISRGAVFDENVFQGKIFVQEADRRADPVVVSGCNYEYSNLTDGIIYPADYKIGRYSSDTNTAAADATPTKIAAATIDLDGEYILNELRFCIFNRDHNNIGTNFTVEVFADGEWVTVIDSLPYDVLNTAEYVKHIANPEDGTGKSTDWLTFDLGGIKASKLRFHSDPLSGKGVSFYEAECYGTLVETNYVNVLNGKEIVGAKPVYVNSSLSSDAYDYDKLNDGIMSNDWKIGRYVSAANGALDATVDLEDRYALKELRLYLFRGETVGSLGQNWKIEAYLDGNWTSVKTIASNAAFEGLVTSLDGDSLEDRFVSIDLGGVVAEKLRFSASAVSGNSISITEMRCLGVSDEDNADFGNVLEGKQFVGATATDVSGQYRFGYDKLTDGVMSSDWRYGRFSSSEGLDGTIDLQGVYRLNNLKIYSYQLEKGNLQPAGQNWTVQVYLDGVWKTVKTIAANEDLASLVFAKDGGTLEDKWISIDLGGVFAEKIRLTADLTDLGYISVNEIRCSAVPAKHYASYSDNVLDGFTFVGSEPAASDAFGYDKLTDGETDNGRYSSPDGGSFGAALDFGGVYLLGKMRFYLSEGQDRYAGENWSFEVYLNGEWKTVKTVAAHEAIVALKKTEEGSGSEDAWIEVDLGCVAAEKVRLSAVSYDGQGITFTEIRCSGYEMMGSSVDRSNVIEAYEKAITLRALGEVHATKLELFREYLTDFKLTDKSADEYAKEMTDYFKTAMKNAAHSLGYTPKVSVTLGASVIMNVYIPVVNTLEFALDETNYIDLSALSSQVVTIDGKPYYRMPITLNAESAARTVPLAVKISLGDTVATGRYQFSVLKYAASVFATGTEVEKQSIRDVLSYIRAAYDYFGSDTDGTIETIDSLIGERYDETSPVQTEGSTDTPSRGISSVTFSLTSTPALTFCIDGSAPAEAYEFFIGKEKLNVEYKTDGDKTYIILDLYAYAMCETVTYRINGEEAGSYHLAAYRNWAQTQNNNKLVTLVERFWKYCQSARDFRNR